MSGRVISQYVLACDGCTVEIGADGGYATATEARAAAYALGWRYPAKVNGSGRPSSNTSDVCPTCLPDWKPALSSYNVQRERP